MRVKYLANLLIEIEDYLNEVEENGATTARELNIVGDLREIIEKSEIKNNWRLKDED